MGSAPQEPVPPWMAEDLPSVDGLAVAPERVDELAAWYAAHPDGTLIAGATDVGLWVTKDFRDLGPVAFLIRVDELNVFEEHSDRFEIGAMVTVADVERQMRAYEPGFAELLVRYGSDQVRQAATLGGNIANGSPIGDGSPALIAMGARLHLRKGTARREIALEDFFLRYGQQDRASGEFVERITVPKQAARRAFYKVSKRFDQDISAVCGCFSLRETDGVMRDVRLAFGGMAGTPMRAAKAEALMEGASPAAAVFAKAAAALAKDFSPMTDMRGTAHYRMEAAQGLLRRFWLERVGVVTDLHGVTA